MADAALVDLQHAQLAQLSINGSNPACNGLQQCLFCLFWRLLFTLHCNWDATVWSQRCITYSHKATQLAMTDQTRCCVCVKLGPALSCELHADSCCAEESQQGVKRLYSLGHFRMTKPWLGTLKTLFPSACFFTVALLPSILALT